MKNIYDYGLDESFVRESHVQGLIPARVTAVHRDRFLVVSEFGTGYARCKAGVYYNDADVLFPTVGDFVMMQQNDSGDSLIMGTATRKSCFSRRDPQPGEHREQVVAANFDYVFIMSSLNNELNHKRIDRYLALVWQSGAIPVVLLTKADLAQIDGETVSKVGLNAAMTECIAISVKTGQGTDALEKYLQPRKTVVFLGSSGVGKSSLVNYLEGKDVMTVNEIREADSKGRHTTTHRQLVMLKSGAMVIDTPGMRELGMRELGMWDADIGVGLAFGDIEAYFEMCRFVDCSHSSEPGCAVRCALESGQLTQERWDSYLKLKKESRYISEKNAFIESKRQRFKQIGKLQKHIKKYGKY